MAKISLLCTVPIMVRYGYGYINILTGHTYTGHNIQDIHTYYSSSSCHDKVQLLTKTYQTCTMHIANIAHARHTRSLQSRLLSPPIYGWLPMTLRCSVPDQNTAPTHNWRLMTNDVNMKYQ